VSGGDGVEWLGGILSHVAMFGGWFHVGSGVMGGNRVAIGHFSSGNHGGRYRVAGGVGEKERLIK